MIWVAAYCRVSTDKGDQANSFEAQQRFFREYIHRHPDWALYDIYADEGITGTSTTGRTQFNRMIADARAEKFSMILTKEVSRFSRNILDTITFTRELKAMGVGVIFLTENLNSLNPESELLLTVMGMLAQEESRRTSERVKWGQTRQMERGVVFGHSLLGYDVWDGQLFINPAEAELVRLIFHKYAVEKKGSSTIARELRQAGYRPRSGNSRWNVSHIIKILRNEKYVGDLIQKKSMTPDYLTHAKKRNHGQEALIVQRDHHSPIVSREIWEAAQEELAKRNKQEGRGYSNRYLFSGRIRCGECGAVFVGRQKAGRDGSKVRWWRCGTAVTEGTAGCCVGRMVRDDEARRMLQTAIQRLPFDREAIVDQVAGVVMDTLGEFTDDLERLRWKLESVRRKRDACLDAYFAGDITKEEMQSAKGKYNARIADLERRLGTLPSDAGPDESEIRQAIADLLSGNAESDAFYKPLLDHLLVCRDGTTVLKLANLPQVFRFCRKFRDNSSGKI